MSTTHEQAKAAQHFDLNRLRAETLVEIRADRDRLLDINSELLTAMKDALASLQAAAELVPADPTYRREWNAMIDAYCAAITKAEGRTS